MIASSSFFADEVDEATVVSVTTTTTSSPSGDVVSRVALDAPLSYTHLGVVVAPPAAAAAGLTRPAQPLDMRATVALLSRNVVLQGDAASANSMFGARVSGVPAAALPANTWGFCCVVGTRCAALCFLKSGLHPPHITNATPAAGGPSAAFPARFRAAA